jgi:LytS/YehU family sensor histidine kinase
MPLNRTAIVRQTDFTVNNGVVYPLTASVFAIGIKMAKNFYLQQKQYELLSKQKIAAEVQLLKSQVHPRFLFRSLNSIYHHMLKGSVHSPEMLLKLSDLLSYILYESDTGLVPLEKELILLRNYIDLEKSNWGDKLSVQEKENIRGSDKMVAPLLLLPLAEYIFEIADGYRQQQLLLISQISVIENTFLLSLGIVGNVEESLDPLKENIQLQQVQKRLQALYNGKHDFKIAADEGGVAVSLSIELQDEIKTAQ